MTAIRSLALIMGQQFTVRAESPVSHWQGGRQCGVWSVVTCTAAAWVTAVHYTPAGELLSPPVTLGPGTCHTSWHIVTYRDTERSLCPWQWRDVWCCYYLHCSLPPQSKHHTSVGAGAGARCGPSLNIIITTLPTPHYHRWKVTSAKFEVLTITKKRWFSLVSA